MKEFSNFELYAILRAYGDKLASGVGTKDEKLRICERAVEFAKELHSREDAA